MNTSTILATFWRLQSEIEGKSAIPSVHIDTRVSSSFRYSAFGRLTRHKKHSQTSPKLAIRARRFELCRKALRDPALKHDIDLKAFPKLASHLPISCIPHFRVLSLLQ